MDEQQEPLRDPKSTHYNLGPPLSDYQAIDVLRSAMNIAEFRGFLRGNILKYTLRMATSKDPARDAEKARFYATWLAQHVSPSTDEALEREAREYRP